MPWDGFACIGETAEVSPTMTISRRTSGKPLIILRFIDYPGRRAHTTLKARLQPILEYMVNWLQALMISRSS